MTDIFPFIDVDETPAEEMEREIPMAREYAWDFEERDFKFRNGKMFLVEEDQAVKIWLWKLFNTERYRYLIYDWDYGNEFESLIGRAYTPNYLEAEIVGDIKESINYNLGDYVTAVKNIEVDFKDGILTIDISVTTIYGEVELIV